MQDKTKLKVKTLVIASLLIIVLYFLVLVGPSLLPWGQSAGESTDSGHRVRAWITWAISSPVTIFLFSVGTTAAVHGDHLIVTSIRLLIWVGVTFSLSMASSVTSTDSSVATLISYTFGTVTSLTKGAVTNVITDWLYWVTTKEGSDDPAKDTYLENLKRDTPVSWIIDWRTWVRERGSQAEGAARETGQNGNPYTFSLPQSSNTLWQAQGKPSEVSGPVECQQSSYRLLGDLSSESFV